MAWFSSATFASISSKGETDHGPEGDVVYLVVPTTGLRNRVSWRRQFCKSIRAPVSTYRFYIRARKHNIPGWIR